jgi:predicted anti-sigma-YlaC factor YlaD
MHLWMCANCRRFERQIGLMRRLLRQAVRSAETGTDDTPLSPEARERIRRAIEARQQQAPK